ncbi:MAG: M14 family metallopeptidase [Fimbriimonadaceae bacterium]
MLRKSIVIAGLLVAPFSFGQVPSPKEFFGHDVCEDYWLANYKQYTAYMQELDKKSDRLSLESIGKTEFGNEQLMAIVTDPGNRRNLQNYRKASERLARGRGFKDDADALNFAKKQKAVIWIDGGLHASESLVAQQLIETAYRLTSSTEPTVKRFLKDCVILLVHANPDGMDLVADWYMRKPVPKERSLAGLPVLYQKYCGHDNNRDFYANNMAETKNMNRILYSVWYPQIVYNHHQSAPAGTIMFCPPFRNPFNYNMDPMIEIGTELLGTFMHQRMISEGKRGTAMRGSTLYSTWWNGGLRTTTYFHNMIGILTETYGSPNPGPLPFVPRFQIPSTDVPFPVEAGRMWHLRDSLEYEISANYAILDYASRNREKLLFDFYRAAKNQIELGSKDSWTPYPSRVALGAEGMKKPENRDARMYVIPGHGDYTVSKFVEKLIQCGIEVEQLVEDTDSPFAQHSWGTWTKGAFVVRCNQAFRPHVLDMFEPQDHPNDFQYPGGPPIPPYDNAGYTLAFQMGIKFDRIVSPIDLKTEPAKLSPSPTFEVKESIPRQSFHGSKPAPAQYIGAYYLPLNSYSLVNKAWKRGLSVRSDLTHPEPYVIVKADESQIKAMDLPTGYYAVAPISGSGAPLAKKPRLALWDRYGGSMESGWTRWVLEQFAFDFDVVFPPDLDAGNLNAKYDCIILPSGAVPGGGGRGTPAGGNAAGGGVDELGGETGPILQGGGGQNLADDPTIPLMYRQRIGSVTAKTIANLKEFVEQGGHLLCIGSSALNISKQLQLPVESALVDEKGVNLPNTKFYIPGSVLRMKLSRGPLTLGMEDYVDVMYDNSPSFRTPHPSTPSPPEGRGGVETVGFYDSAKPLRSGWAWGQEVLKDTVGVADVPLGKGRVVLYGPEILFRGQSYGTFKLLFNAIFRSANASS